MQSNSNWLIIIIFGFRCVYICENHQSIDLFQSPIFGERETETIYYFIFYKPRKHIKIPNKQAFVPIRKLKLPQARASDIKDKYLHRIFGENRAKTKTEEIIFKKKFINTNTTGQQQKTERNVLRNRKICLYRKIN